MSLSAPILKIAQAAKKASYELAGISAQDKQKALLALASALVLNQDYIIKENAEKKSPNLSFLKIIPFMLNGRTSITYDGIKAKLDEFQNMDDISFQFLNAAVGKMTFGVKELVKVIDGQEVRAEMQFPNGASGIFVIHDAFEAYIKE